VTSRLVATALAGLSLLLAGCDNDSSTPTSPSGATLQVTAARPVLRTGEAAPLTVTSSTGAPVTTAVWTSTDTSAGRVTVTAASGGSSGSLALRVVPDYQGTWKGGLTRAQLTCSPTSTTPICAPGAATSGTLTLSVVQTGDQLTGVLTDSAEPTVPVPLTGTVQSDDQLALAGSGPTPAPTVRAEVSTMRGSIDAAVGSLSGSYQWLVDRPAVPGGALQADYRALVQFRDLRR
jgi:hypothetical protein